jgi:hypothetical protein
MEEIQMITMISISASRAMLVPALILLLILLAVPCGAGNWSVLPVLGYSSSSGVQIGGLIANLHQEERSARLLSVLAWYGTRGAFVLEPDLRLLGSGGIWKIGGAYRKRTDARWYGWGNGGDNDSLALFDMEQQQLYGSLEKPLGGGFLLRSGVEVRHSTAYDFEDSDLFDSSPSSETSSIWTAGPEIELSHSIRGPVTTTASIGGSCQTGETSYGSADCSVSLLVGLDEMTSTGLNLELARYFRTESTPFPFLPSLGGGDGLRGFAGNRFRGDWSTLANLELRRVLFMFRDHEGREFGIGAVLFADAGQVGDSPDDFRWDRFHLDVGAGFRSYLPAGALLRADIGWSNEGFGVNTGFSELF